MKPIPLVLLSLTLTLAGCGGCAERYVEPQGTATPFRTPQRDYILAIAIDTSSSCLDEMFGKNGRGYQFALAAVLTSPGLQGELQCTVIFSMTLC